MKPTASTIRVFLVDDDEVDRLEIKRLLQDVEDIELREFDSGEAALAAIASEGCDCLLLDHRLPELDGLELLDQISAAELSVPTIMLTGARDEEIAVNSVHRGVLDYISKGKVSREVLLTKIQVARLLHAAGKRASAAERNLRETVAQLRREIQARESVLGVVSHDLRGPLNNIGLAMNLLESDNPELRATAIGSVRRAIARAERLINDLLDVARVSAAEFELEQRPILAQTLVDTAVLEVRPAVEANCVEIEIDAPDEDVAVLADRDRVIQVLDNLLRNALKYGPEGGTIVVGLRADADHVEFSVCDEGPGLSVEERAHVFDRFWQAKTRGGSKGSGLGLAIAKAIVKAHGGEIDVGPAEHGGARFMFTIPRAHED